MIIATHSPRLMAYPGATLLHLTDTGLIERSWKEAENGQILRMFCLDPERFMGQRVFKLNQCSEARR